MADLFTHFVAARVPGGWVRDRRLQALLVLGTFLPDIVGKGLRFVLQSHNSSPLATHSLAGVLLLSYLACLFVEEGLRRRGFAMLVGGGMIHLLVDLAKDHQGMGAVFPFLPFSAAGVELGWIHSENVIYLIPLDAAILAAAWLLERRCARVQQ